METDKLDQKLIHSCIILMKVAQFLIFFFDKKKLNNFNILIENVLILIVNWKLLVINHKMTASFNQIQIHLLNTNQMIIALQFWLQTPICCQWSFFVTPNHLSLLLRRRKYILGDVKNDTMPSENGTDNLNDKNNTERSKRLINMNFLISIHLISFLFLISV